MIICLAGTSFASQCVVDGSEGTWVEITQFVPEGNCLDTVYEGRINTGGIYARYYMIGRSARYRIYVPTTASHLSCLTGSAKTCNCIEFQEDAVNSDAYRDCWNVAERCAGSTCKGYPYGDTVSPPDCTECWSVSCWHISENNYSHRRRVSEWICNDCRSAYDALQAQCGTAPVLNWDNETCTGDCPTVQNYGPPPDKCETD